LHLAKTLIAGAMSAAGRAVHDLDVETLRALEDACWNLAGSVL